MVGESRRVIPHIPNGKCGKPIATEKGGIFGVRNVVNCVPTLRAVFMALLNRPHKKVGAQ